MFSNLPPSPASTSWFLIACSAAMLSAACTGSTPAPVGDGVALDGPSNDAVATTTSNTASTSGTVATPVGTGTSTDTAQTASDAASTSNPAGTTATGSDATTVTNDAASSTTATDGPSTSAAASSDTSTDPSVMTAEDPAAGQCSSDRSVCGTICVSTDSDPLHCGGCDQRCPNGEVCSAGQCGSGCAAHLTACDGACVDVTGSPINCGECGRVCDMGLACRDGDCVCPVGQDLCAGGCVDLLTDTANCGACGTQCGGGEDCLTGTCISPDSLDCGGGAQTNRACTAYDFIEMGPYWVNNNVWGEESGSGEQCVWQTCRAGDIAGWGTDWTWSGASNEVKSYASIVFGWHWGWKVNNTGLPVQLNSGRDITCAWSFNVSQSGTLNVSYDLWAHQIANPGSNDDPNDEIMIWLYRDQAGPIGGRVTTVNIAGADWDLHHGDNGYWEVSSFVRTSNTETAVFNLMDFLDDLVGRGWLSSNQYLTSIQAGTEVFTGSGSVQTNGFYCRIQ